MKRILLKIGLSTKLLQRSSSQSYHFLQKNTNELVAVSQTFVKCFPAKPLSTYPSPAIVKLSSHIVQQEYTSETGLVPSFTQHYIVWELWLFIVMKQA